MILKFRTNNDKNGNNKQLMIDTENKTYTYGSYLFISYDCKVSAKKDLQELINVCKLNGYTPKIIL